MRIGIDIDETIAATFSSIVPHIQKVWAPNFGWDDFTEHDMWNIPELGLTKENTIRIWDAWWIEE